MVGALRFEMLGPVRAFRGGEPVDLGPPVQRAVLAVLLLHAGEPVPVRQIVAALWNGDPPANAVDVVQRCVGGLRRVLDPERTSLIALTDGGYVLRAGEQAVDTGLFRAALARARAEHRTGDLGAAGDEVREALDRWRDQPLAGLTGPVFESARARLNEERATASAMLAQPVRIEAKPVTERLDTAPARPEPPATEPPRPEPSATGPAFSEPRGTGSAHSEPRATDPAHSEPPATGPAHSEPSKAGPAQPEPHKAGPAYPEPTDPWAGHDLFPPDPPALG